MRILNKFKKLIAVAATFTLVAGSLLTGCGSKDGADGDLQTVRIAVMTGQADYYAALLEDKQGIYKKHGIKLEFTEYVAGINTIDAVVTGVADIGMMADFATVNRIGNTINDTNLVIFSQISNGISQNGGLYVAPQYENNLKSLDGSKGFITQIGTVTEYYNALVFEKLGIDEKKQNIINTDSVQTSLALANKNQASAIYITGSGASKFEEQGWKLALKSKDLGIEAATYWLTTSAYNEANQELIGKFLEASQEAFDYIDANLDETASYFESFSGLAAADFKANWKAVSHKVGFTEESAKHLESIEKWGYNHGKYSTDYDIRKFINADAAKKVLPSQVTIQ